MGEKVLLNLLALKVLILSRSSILVSCWSLGRLHKGQWHRAGYIIQGDMARGSGEIWKIQHHTNYTSDAWSGQVYQHSGLNNEVDVLEMRFWNAFFLRKYAYFYSNFTGVCSRMSNWQVSIGSGGGLVTNRQQARIWNDADRVLSPHLASPGDNEIDIHENNLLLRFAKGTGL